MELFTLIFVFAITLMVSAISLASLRRAAVAYRFVDKPTSRKKHFGEVPFIGGISIYLALMVGALLEPTLFPNVREYVICSSILVIVGIVDDKFDISAVLRLFILACISIWLVNTKGISLTFLGSLTNNGVVLLESGYTWLTLAAVIGCISAFNMVDGIDGLLSALSSIAFISLGYLYYSNGYVEQALFCALLVTAMLPFVLCNLDLIPNRSLKVFMGDSGSYLIGFTIVWLLIHSTQPSLTLNAPSVQPVTALWIIALPLMDMALVMCRRMLKKNSPFRADRLHLHHICIRLGLSSNQTLIFMTTIASAFALFGIWGQITHIGESMMFSLFMCAFLAYVGLITYLDRIIRFSRKVRTFKGYRISKEV